MPDRQKPKKDWTSKVEERTPEQQLGEYIGDYLESWHHDYANKSDGVGSFIEMKMHDESTHDFIVIHAERNSHLGRILTALHTLRFP